MLNDVEERLRVCFRTVFPNLPDETISSAAQTNVAAWDSVATATLVSVIDEEFGVERGLYKVAEFDFFTRSLVQIGTQVRVSDDTRSDAYYEMKADRVRLQQELGSPVAYPLESPADCGPREFALARDIECKWGQNEACALLK